ncbi:MAG: gliding motility-associated C-terminal domain-containing protein [Bacteroidia bacterium]|jgi:gliding motility-associated-like protein|nr:gliding motility-associated C-terminal domain-containing protein [Bacteroidia bacterium]
MKQLFFLQLLTALGWSGLSPVFSQDFAAATEEVSCFRSATTAFSPNGDGINDVFDIQHECAFSSYELRIYDMAGHLIFSSAEGHPTWNGMIRMQPAPEGFYRWELVGEMAGSHAAIRQTGELVLAR